MACFLSNKVAAVAPVSGSLSPEDYDSCDPQRPMPVIHVMVWMIHGFQFRAVIMLLLSSLKNIGARQFMF